MIGVRAAARSPQLTGMCRVRSGGCNNVGGSDHPSMVTPNYPPPHLDEQWSVFHLQRAVRLGMQ